MEPTSRTDVVKVPRRPILVVVTAGIIGSWTGITAILAVGVAWEVRRLLAGSPEVDWIALLVLLPITVFMALMALIMVLGFRGALKPDSYARKHYTRFGETHEWATVVRVHLNPDLPYVTVVLAEPLEPDETDMGFTIPKRSMRPSLSHLLDLLNALAIPVETEGNLRVRELSRPPRHS